MKNKSMNATSSNENNRDMRLLDLHHRKDKKKILSVEVGGGHDVIRPSIYKYFTQLGYEVDFLLYGNNRQERWNFFCRMPDFKSHELIGDEAFIAAVLSSPAMREYDYIFLNSNFVYTQHRFDSNWDYRSFMKALKIPDTCKHGFLTIPPHPAFYVNSDTNVRWFTHLGVQNTPMLSASYFGDVQFTGKSSKNVFLITGNINTGQKNHNMVFEAAKKLLAEQITNFEIWVDGMVVNEFSIPSSLQQHIKYVGENKPESLFPLIEQTDFIIAGMDSQKKWQLDAYSKGTCSASLMYALGFGKPYICETVFANAFGLNDTNALLHARGELASAMKKAIRMSGQAYNRLQHSMLQEAKRRETRSLTDIARTLDELKAVYQTRRNKMDIHCFRDFLRLMRKFVCFVLHAKERKKYCEKLQKYSQELVW